MSGRISLIDFGVGPEVSFGELVPQLAHRFDREILRGAPMDIPEIGFNPSRNQYLAGAFLSKLRILSGPEDHKYLGITTVDLYSQGLTLVFGQAHVGGKAAVISLARLHPKGVDCRDQAADLRQERVLKEAVHELGHTFGLAHCRDDYCVMHFSHDIADTDVKTADFCPRHQAEL